MQRQHFTTTNWVKPIRSLETFMDEVREFAIGDYAVALMKGSSISAAERADIVKKLASYTGLTPEYIERTDLRINIARFCKEAAPR